MNPLWRNPKLVFLLAAALSASAIVAAQQDASGTLGIFTASSDVGATLKGSTVYDAAGGSYKVTGGGQDMWGSEDDFHFAWVKLTGDATLTADVQVPPEAAIPNKKGVLIFRQSLDPASAYADIAIHGDGHATLQFRATAGAKTEDVVAPLHHPATLRIERKGNLFTAYVGSGDGKLTAFSSTTVDLDGPVYVGIGVCSHNAAGLTTATFSNVSLDPR